MIVSEALADLGRRAAAFRDARDWKQFHNAKDMAISLVLEATELLEEFQWKDDATAGQRTRIEDELADVLYWVVLIARDLEIDLADAFQAKLAKNEAKYPVSTAKGQAKKYTEL